MTENPPPSPGVPPGWYPDPSQVATQRYWDGETWTDQRAPLPPTSAPEKSSASIQPSARLVLGILGALAAVVAVFLPHADSAGVLKVANNNLISSSDGIIVIVLAIAGAAAAIRDANSPRLSWALALLGLVLIGVAFFEGSSEQIQIVNGLGQEVDSSPGAGVYTLGVGGLLMLAAGFARWRTPGVDPTTPEPPAAS